MAREVYTLADLQDWPAATLDAQPPLRLAVCGDPVAHSASPPMHNAALSACGIDAQYTRLHIRPEELAEALPLIARQGFIGVNLTIPHKTAALPLLDEVDGHAASLGAVNTVRVEPSGRLRGFNTDGPGFVQAVRAELGMGLRGQRVLLLGAGGGAGRALAAQCVLEGCARLVLVNRTAEKARRLLDDLRARAAAGGWSATDLQAVAWDDASLAAALAGVDLVVNASAVGLQSGDRSPIPAASIPSEMMVFDTVYRSGGEATPLVEAARQAGARAVGGHALLLYQGALAFEHWFGQPAPVEVMRRALEKGGCSDPLKKSSTMAATHPF